MFPLQQNIHNAHWRIRHSFENQEHRLIGFMTDLALASKTGCRVVLEAGLLDILLAVSLLELRPDDPLLWTACNSAMNIYSEDVTSYSIFSSHPLRVLWPKTNIEANHFLERQRALGDLEQTNDAVMLRITAIESVKSLSEYPIKKPQTLDMCADIFQFARYFYRASVIHLLIWRTVDSSETLDVALSDRAMTHLIESMRRSPRLVSKIITEIFETDCEGTIDIMSSLLRRVFRTYVEPIFLAVPIDMVSNINQYQR
jgi:hypothetical protein